MAVKLFEEGVVLQADTSFTASALLGLFTVLSLVLSCWLARYPRKTGAGIALGVLVGAFLITLTSGLVAFLGNVVPFGQIDFWLAHSLANIFG